MNLQRKMSYFCKNQSVIPKLARRPQVVVNNHTEKQIHCVKIVQIRSFFWSVFSCIRTVYGDLRSKSEKVPYLDTFHAVLVFASRKVVSGEASCVMSTTTGRKQTKVKTIIFGDSIPKGIRYRESNQMLKNGLAQFKIFPGIASLP